MEQVFTNLLNALQEQKRLIEELNLKIQQLEIGGGGGGGGNAVIADYAPSTEYKHNALVHDINNHNLYLVVCPVSYMSIDVDTDRRNGNLKLINSDVLGNLLVLDHDPTGDEIQEIDENTVVVVYSPSDDPFVPSE